MSHKVFNHIESLCRCVWGKFHFRISPAACMWSLKGQREADGEHELQPVCLSLLTGRIIILTVRLKGAIRDVFAALYITISKILHPLESGLLININDSQSAERFGF